MNDLTQLSDDELKALYQKQRTPDFLDSPVGGFIRGARDIVDGGAQLLTRGLEAIAPEGSAFEQYMRQERQRVEGINKEAERDYQENWRGGDMEGIDWGRLAGNIAATGPVARLGMGIGGGGMGGKMVGSAAVGAGSAALMPTQGDKAYWAEKSNQMAYGGLGGAIAAPVAAGVSRIVSPKSSDAARRLMAEGVDLTPGQAAGGMINRMEQRATSVPILGDMVRARQADSIESFNKAIANRALSKVGQSVPGKVKAGRELVDYTSGRLSQAYDDLLPKLSAVSDGKFGQDVDDITGALFKKYPTAKDRVINLLKGYNDRFKGGNTVSGEDIKLLQKDIRADAVSFKRSPDPENEAIGRALEKLNGALRGAVKRSNPGTNSGKLDDLDAAWATLSRMSDAAGRTGSQDGVFSPEAFRAVVRAADTNRGKTAFAAGRLPLSQMADDAVDVLGRKVPDSGTPERMMGPLAASLGAGLIDPTLGVLTGASMLGYTKAGNKALVAALAKRPDIAKPIAKAISEGSPAQAARLAAALLGPSLPARD